MIPRSRQIMSNYYFISFRMAAIYSRKTVDAAAGSFPIGVAIKL